jgi:hypothetical protein
MILVPRAYVSAQGPPGYTFAGWEGQTFVLPQLSHVAYGANGAFIYKFNQTGSITFNSETFGGDPIWGEFKAGYFKITDGNETTQTLLDAFGQLLDHCNNNTLSPVEINALADSIQQNVFLIADSLSVITAAFDLINCYETHTGPLFLNAHTAGGMPNAPGSLDGFEYDRAIFRLQQGLFDYLYTPYNIVKYSPFLNGKKYLTADYFPGPCPLPADSAKAYTKIINASMPEDWGRPTAWSNASARRPTGYYLSPGTIGKVKVPEVMVNTGYKILVGAHTAQHMGIDPILRFFKVFNTYDITDSVTLIANPFGGGIYLLTPYLANAGLQSIELSNVVPAPFFTAKSFETTSLSDWQNEERHHDAPWADFETEKFMMQVPTSFIYHYDDPSSLMADWDARLDVVSRLLGYPLVRNNQILYVQLDVNIIGGNYSIGNPQINNTYNPYEAQNGNSTHWFLSPGASNMWETEFHELGHAQAMGAYQFPGETEAIVNLPAAAIFHQLYGIDIDSALGLSFNNEAWRTRDQAAINWMVTPNFRAGKPMDISNTVKDEVRYQHRGYAKYVEIAALFGWEVLHDFYYQSNIDYNNQIPPGILSPTDDRILKLSQAAGADLRPLIHFWGVHPNNSTALAQAIVSNQLPPSSLICNRLEHYKSIIPMDNTQFGQHAAVFFNGPVPPGGNPNYANGWYNYWLPLYNELHADSAVVSLQNIISTYFPNGCEVVDVKAVFSTGNCISASPNPTTGPLYIQTNCESSFSIELTDAVGKTLRKYESFDNANQPEMLDLTGLPNGMYFLRINTGKSFETLKIVVEK